MWQSEPSAMSFIQKSAISLWPPVRCLYAKRDWHLIMKIIKVIVWLPVNSLIVPDVWCAFHIHKRLVHRTWQFTGLGNSQDLATRWQPRTVGALDFRRNLEFLAAWTMMPTRRRSVSELIVLVLIVLRLMVFIACPAHHWENPLEILKRFLSSNNTRLLSDSELTKKSA